MTGPSYPRNILCYRGEDQEQKQHVRQEQICTTSTPQSHSYHTRQRANRIQIHKERYGPYRHREKQLRIQVKSSFIRSSIPSHSMGGSFSRGMKQMKSDGNGNFEFCPSPSLPESSQNLPVRLEMALDQPKEDKDEQVKHAWNPNDRSLNIFVKDNDPFTFHRYGIL